MRVTVHYHGGMTASFVVPEDILVVDFTAIARKLGRIRRVEFP